MASTLFTYRYVLKNPHTGVRWTDGQGTHNVQTAKALKRGSLGTVEAVLAHHYKVHAALQKAAAQFYMRAATRMAMHRDTGAARVGLEAGDELDWYVFLTERNEVSTRPDKNAKGRRKDGTKQKEYSRKRSALSIEFGHKIRGSDREVGGLYILTGAANAMARNPMKEW
jgi:hypothetical protein